jgi:hypothetical protein
MTKVSIIEINLGDIDAIISENVAELHGEAKSKLEDIIQQRKLIQEKLREKEEQKEKEANEIVIAISDVYEMLEKAGNDGIAYGDIEDRVNSVIPNMTSFTIRMKSLLKEKGNPFIIQKKKKKGTIYYYFEPFNGDA